MVVTMSEQEPEPRPQLARVEEDTALTAMALKAMAHPLRWKILCSLGEQRALRRRDRRAHRHLAEQHLPALEQLRNKNIVVARKEANRIYYRIRNHQLLELIGIMRDVLCPANLDDRYPALNRRSPHRHCATTPEPMLDDKHWFTEVADVPAAPSRCAADASCTRSAAPTRPSPSTRPSTSAT
jgi:DNA-binding transcriptional ArsR family regulator